MSSALTDADQDAGLRDYVDRLRSWGENDPDPGYFTGDVLHGLLLDCGHASVAFATLRSRATAAEAERDSAQKMLGAYEEQHEETSQLVRFMSGRIKELKAETEGLREALIGLDQRIWTDPQVIERAGEWRGFIRAALASTERPASSEEASDVSGS